MDKEVGPPCYRQLKMPKYNFTIIELTLKNTQFCCNTYIKITNSVTISPGKTWNLKLFEKNLEQPKIS